MVLAALSLSIPGSYSAFSTSSAANVSLTAASSFYAADVTSDGAVGYWRLDGSTVTDSVGGHDGTVVGTPTIVPGTTPDGDSATKTTTAGNLIVPWTATGNATIELWFNVTAGTATVGNTSRWDQVSPLTSTEVGSNNGDFGVGLDSAGDLVAGMGTGSTDVTIASTGVNYKDGLWHYVAWTRNSATGAMVLYADGASVATGTGGTELLNARPYLSIGADSYISASAGSIPPPLAAGIDDVAEYSAVLTAAQVAAHDAAWASGYSTMVQADSPTGYWRLDGPGPVATATVGPDGTLDGNVTYGVVGAITGDTAVRLVPTAAYVQVPRLVSDDLSLEFWFKDGSPVENGHSQWYEASALLDADVAGGSANDFGISLDATGHVLAGVGNPDTTIRTSSGGFADGAWHYVVFTRTKASGAIALWVDGVQQASNPGTGNTNSLTSPTMITLGEYAAGIGGAGAVIDELAQYPLVLTPAQITAHFQQG